MSDDAHRERGADDDELEAEQEQRNDHEHDQHERDGDDGHGLDAPDIADVKWKPARKLPAYVPGRVFPHSAQAWRRSP